MGLLDGLLQPGQTKSELVDLLISKSNKQSQPLSANDYIKDNEGYRDTIYKDTKGKRTTGYGFNLEDEATRALLPSDVVSGKRKLTREEADFAFEKRFQMATNDAISFMGGQDNFAKLTESQKQGLVDMSYNLGLTSLNGFGELRKALYLGDKEKAKKEVLDSKYKDDVPNRALSNANLMLQ